MPRFTLLLVLLLALSAPLQAEDTWKPLQVQGQFQVDMPGEVERLEQAADRPTVLWESHSSEPLQAFSVMVTEMPPDSIREAGEDPILVSAMKGRVQASGGKLLRTRRIVSNRLPGCTFEVETGDSRWDYMIRLDGDRVYTLSVTSLIDDANPAAVERFFNSFHVP